MTEQLEHHRSMRIISRGALGRIVSKFMTPVCAGVGHLNSVPWARTCCLRSGSLDIACQSPVKLTEGSGPSSSNSTMAGALWLKGSATKMLQWVHDQDRIVVRHMPSPSGSTVQLSEHGAPRSQRPGEARRPAWVCSVCKATVIRTMRAYISHNFHAHGSCGVL